MIFNGNNKNDLYEKIDVSDERKQNLIDLCMEKHEHSSSQLDNELSLRRTENMKRKEYSNILNKVAVAVLSIGLSGAVIAGVMIYGNGTKKSANLETSENMTEESTEKITEETTENVTEETTEEVTEEVTEEETEEVKEKTTEDTKEENSERFKNSIFYKNENLNYLKVKELENPNVYELKVGDYFIKTIEVADEENGGKVKRKIVYTDNSGGKEIEIPNAREDSFYNYLFFNGESILYFNKNILYKYNMKTQEIMKVKFDSHKKNYYTLEGIYDGKILCESYYDCNVDGETTIFGGFIYTYDMKSGKIQEEKNRLIQYGYPANDGYFISIKHGNFGKMKTDDYFIDTEVFVEKFTETGFEEIVSLGKCSKYIEDSETKDKIYFVAYDKSDDGMDDIKQIYIKSFNKVTQEVTELAKIREEDVGDAFWGIWDDIYHSVIIDGMLEITDNYINDGEYKYTFATKKIEKIADDE